MNETERRVLVAELPGGYPPEIAHWLWMFADTRRRTLEVIDGLRDDQLDIAGPGGNSIGTILAHIALIETDWLCVEILGEDYPDAMLALLPPDVRDADGSLLATPGLPLSRYMDMLTTVRAYLIERVGALEPVDLRRVRTLPPYDVSPDWVLNHLIQHEAEHRSEIATVRLVIEGRRRI